MAIELPQWYACCATASSTTPSSGEPAPEAGGEDTLRIGPLTIVRPTRGCEVASFGSATTPSVVIFDGYLFDRDALAAELGVREPCSNAELAAAGYQRWGAGVINRLDGCYLVAVWDGESRRLLVGHDALGRHPVFYATPPGAVWFASNILALASSGRVSRRPNRLSLALAVMAWWPEAGHTFFEAIQRLRPGYYLDVDRSAIAERKYWDPLPEDDEPWLPEREVHETFEPMLQQAVDRCMALGPRGIMLSGGVDSVTVAALAAEYWKAHGSAPLVSVSGRTGGELSYEEIMQGRVAQALGMPLRASRLKDWTQGRDDVTLSLEATPELPSPSRVYWVGSYTRFYRQTAGDGVSVLLTGAGGDNWLGVADAHAADLLRGLRFGQLYRFLKADMGTGGQPFGYAARRVLWTGGVRPHVETLYARLAPAHKARRHRRTWDAALPAWVCPDTDLREALLQHLLARRTPALGPTGRAPRSYYRQAVRAVSNPYMHYEFETAYHMETACGLRLLSPYHDRRLVRFFNRIPPTALVYGNRYKGLLRPVVGKYLPQLGLEDQRKHYPRNEQYQAMEDLRQGIAAAWPAAHFDTLGRLGVVDPAAVKQPANDPGHKGFDALVRMFIMLSAERWTSLHAGA